MHWPNAREFHNSVPDLLRVPIKSFFKENLLMENILVRFCMENMSPPFLNSCSHFVLVRASLWQGRLGLQSKIRAEIKNIEKLHICSSQGKIVKNRSVLVRLISFGGLPAITLNSLILLMKSSNRKSYTETQPRKNYNSGLWVPK